MKAGMVTQIRVNPKDCLAILDLMVACGIDPYDGRSFAQCTSLALSSLVGVARKAGIIPLDEDGFQYANRMAPFLNSRNDKRKYRYDEMLYKRASADISAPDMAPNIHHPGQAIPDHIRQATAGQGYTEHGATSSEAQPLLMDEGTRELLSEEMQALYDKGALTTEEQARLTELNNLLYS